MEELLGELLYFIVEISPYAKKIIKESVEEKE